MPTSTETIRRYLLGETTEAESEALEKAYFAREEDLDEVLGVEEALIEDYLAGSLTAEQRRRVESRYLASPVRRHRVAMVRALRARAARRRAGWMAPALSLAAALLVALVGAWWWSRHGAVPGDRIASVTLPALQLRDSGASPVATIPPDATALEIRLEDSGVPAAPPFEAAVRTVEGTVIWSGPAIPAERGDAAASWIATVLVPAGVLPTGDYVVLLSSRSTGEPREIQRHYLRVARN